MTKHVALLRAVNVGGTGAVKMAELRAMAEAMGFTEVQTLLQSGNLVFRAPSDKASALEGLIKAELARRFGLTTTVIVRSGRPPSASMNFALSSACRRWTSSGVLSAATV